EAKERARHRTGEPGGDRERAARGAFLRAVSAVEIAARRDEVLGRIARAAERAGRAPGAVALLAVTKTHPAEVVRQAALAGLTRFGENRVAEGTAKIAVLAVEWPGLEWRLIGPLQSNKAKPALQYFSVIESLDR